MTDIVRIGAGRGRTGHTADTCGHPSATGERLAVKIDRPQALLWDNDGVLVDTEAIYLRASRDVLASAGIDLTQETFVELSLRRGMSVFRLAEAEGISPERVAEMRVDRDRRYLELVSDGAPVIDGVRETLAVLADVAPMAIVTSCKRQHFEAIHSRSGLLEAFEFALTAEDYEGHKPDPAPYLAGAARLGVDPQQCPGDRGHGARIGLCGPLPACAVWHYRTSSSPRATSALRGAFSTRFASFRRRLRAGRTPDSLETVRLAALSCSDGPNASGCGSIYAVR